MVGSILKPEYAEAYYNRGLAHYEKGAVDIALRDFEEYAILFLAKSVILNVIQPLIQTHIDENINPSEFLSNEDIAFLDKKLEKDKKELFEEIKEERQRLILSALLDQVTNPVEREPS